MDYVITQVEESVKTDKNGQRWKVIHYYDNGVLKKKDVFNRDLYFMLVVGNVFSLVQNGVYQSKKTGEMLPNMDVAEIRKGELPPEEPPKADYERTNRESTPVGDPRQRSIERQNALTNAINFCARLKYDPLTPTIESVRDVLTVADMLVNWTSQGIIPIPQTEAVSSPAQEEKPTGEQINLKGAGYEDTVKNMGRSLGFTTIKHLADFMKANAKVLQNRTDWKSFDADLQYALVTLLQAEIEKMKI